MAIPAAVQLARAYLSRFLVAHAHRRRAQPNPYGPSSQEVAEVLAQGAPVELQNEVEEARVENAERALAEALRATPEPPLARLVRAFGLSKLDTAIVCFLIAPELDHELERAYTFAIDDFTRKRPDLAFVARVLGGDEVLARFDDAAPLRRHGS